MASYWLDKKIFYSGGSCVAVKRQYHQEIYICAALTRHTIYQIVKQFEETGSEFTDGSVTSDIYLSTSISDGSAPFLMVYGIPMHSAWFQKDGARLHVSNALLCFLHDIFKDRILCHVKNNIHGHQSHWT